MINRFREALYLSFVRRADAGLELVDGLTSAERVESPVAISESPLFRRQFSSIYDLLQKPLFRRERVAELLHAHQPASAETIGGYAVYALDCTDDPAPDAETLADRTLWKKSKLAEPTVGHRYSWLVRLVEQGSSWVMPQEVARVPSAQSDSQVAAEQVCALDQRLSAAAVVTADSLYCNAVFLGVFVGLKWLCALVRMRSNQVLYEAPAPRSPRPRGRPPVHGAKFKLADAKRAPDQHAEISLFGQRIAVRAWHNLHLRKLAALVGMVVQVQFLKADGRPRFKRPLYLFWSGPTDLPLEALVRMYLWRFTIEHFFRFMKQQMGLNSARSTDLVVRQNWLWCGALAYSQLLLIRHEVAQVRPAWYPQRASQPVALTPRQVQRQALAFLCSLGTLARAPQPAGKGTGRPLGFRPTPRMRHQPIKKQPKPPKAA